ncbi:MAG: hypothetical protein Q9191_006118 [Dirinaria sp. TL-2023a]
MDPYLDTIPNDRGIEIKKRVAERDGEDHNGRPVKRARAETLSLLPEYSENVVEEPPRPEEDLSKYNEERLKHGLAYITHISKRNITPPLECTTTPEASQFVVKAMDEAYCCTAFLFRPRTSDEHQHLMVYVKLRRLELLANYGDYLGQELQEIRANLKQAALSPDVTPKTYDANIYLGAPYKWTDIAEDLKSVDTNNLRKKVWDACSVLGIDSRHMLWLIDEWAARNQLFHNKVREHISECRWAPLAQQLCRDLKELINVISDEETAAKYEKVLVSIRDEYFALTSHDNPDHWIPSAKATELTQSFLRAKKKKVQKALNKMSR